MQIVDEIEWEVAMVYYIFGFIYLMVGAALFGAGTQESLSELSEKTSNPGVRRTVMTVLPALVAGVGWPVFLVAGAVEEALCYWRWRKNNRRNP